MEEEEPQEDEQAVQRERDEVRALEVGRVGRGEGFGGFLHGKRKERLVFHSAEDEEEYGCDERIRALTFAITITFERKPSEAGKKW